MQMMPGREKTAVSSWTLVSSPTHLLVDRADEGNQTRRLVLEPWGYDRNMYKKNNEIERLFRKFKEFC